MSYVNERVTNVHSFWTTCQDADWASLTCPFTDGPAYPTEREAKSLVSGGGRLYTCTEDGDLKAIVCVSRNAKVGWCSPTSGDVADPAVASLGNFVISDWGSTVIGIVEPTVAAQIALDHPDIYVLHAPDSLTVVME